MTSILDTIGNTPLAEIKSINPNPNVKIFAKLEYFNPGGSIKDRTALEMILDGEKSGKLTRDKIIIEATSGNTGIGLALICAVKKYKLILAMSESASIERQKILRAMGADILLTPSHRGTDGAIEEVYKLVFENPDKYFIADQYNNKANWMAHYKTTANEILRQTDGKITMLVASMGTTGTVMGMSRRLKEHSADIKIVGVEPFLGHHIQGLKNMKESYKPEIFEKNRLDKKINIEDEEAFEMTRRLAREEGIFAGMSSGAAMAAAVKMSAELKDGLIVVIFPDSGERYLSTNLFAVKKKSDMSLFNTMTRAKESFRPTMHGKITIYTCGPAAHADMSINQCRRMVFADLLHRYLLYKGYSVLHVASITDIDDKTIDGAEKAGVSLKEFTQKYIASIKEDLEFLGIEPSVIYPETGMHVEDMLSLCSQLAKRGFAYEKLRSLYFDISRFPGYGRLSGINLNKIRIGATVDLDEYEKDNPRDFTLLKRSKLSELKKGIFFKSDWGSIRPSWHLQGAAISLKHLKENFDIHISSSQLLFPHDENENAICWAAFGKPLAKFWLHCKQVMSKGKRAGADITLKDLTQKGYNAKEIRAWLISAHYRKSIDFSDTKLNETGNLVKRINTCIQNLSDVKGQTKEPETLAQLLYDIKNGFTRAMDNDLNISEALASIFTNVKKINIMISKNRLDPKGAKKIIDEFKKIDSVLGIFNFDDISLDPQIKKLLEQRKQARLDKDWDLADKIREKLKEKGLLIKDKKVN